MLGRVQVPQFARRPPQPSPSGPQVAPACAQVRGTHAATPPHLLGVPPPPQIWVPVHVPQLGVSPPHPSATGPHVAPTDAHVLGTQGPPSVTGTPPPHTLY